MSKKKFYAPVPEKVKRRTYWYQTKRGLNIYDAFHEAVRETYDICDDNLQKAWMTGDLREYIPQAYVSEALDFEKYPLRYKKK